MKGLSPCQPHEADNIFEPRNINRCHRYLRRIQTKLDKAVAVDDKDLIRWYQHLLTKRSRAAKIVAVYQVTKVNKGRYTAGVDQVAIEKNSSRKSQNQVRMKLLQQIDITKKPSPIRRVLIPKANGKRRPLGIPTLADRINQQLIRQSISPICEFHFHNSSYGFRPKRCAQDAMSDLHRKLKHPSSRQWIVDADISGCFDHIDHQQIISTLESWFVTTEIRQIITGWLKAKILAEGNFINNENGTPQGGIISPLLANVALTSLDQFCHQTFGWTSQTKGKTYKVSPIVRYADDFVIVCQSEMEAIQIKDKIQRFLSENIGLKLSEEKTRTVQIHQGFDFLGFHFRKYLQPRNPKRKEILLITPQKDKIQGVKAKLKKAVKSCKGHSQQAVIQKLNPIIRGWANYYRHVVSKKVFNDLDHDIFVKLKQWSTRKHPNKTKAWSMRRYFHQKGKRKWVFMDQCCQKEIFRMATIPIRRFIKVNNDYRVYDTKAKDYWQRRQYTNARDCIYGSGVLTKLFRKQSGQCSWCKTPITEEQIKKVQFHKHHMKPPAMGGTNELSNLRLLHSDCHRVIHGIWSREQMAQFTDIGIDYLRLIKGHAHQP